MTRPAEEFIDLAEEITDRFGLDRATVNIVLRHLDLFPHLVPQKDLGDITRVTLITTEGRVFERKHMYECGVWLDVQDNGRTLKVFPCEFGL